MYKQNVIAVMLALILCLTCAACAKEKKEESKPAKTPKPSAAAKHTDEPTKKPAAPPTDAPTDAPEEVPAVDNSETAVSMLLQDYDGDNIAEIPVITYDGSQSALAATGGRNHEIDALNLDLKSIQKTYNAFKVRADAYSWMEIELYPFVSDDAIQFVLVSNEYPTYGTDGQISSYYFDLQANAYVTLPEMMERLALEEGTVKANVRDLFLPIHDGVTLEEIEVSGFVFYDGQYRFLLRLLIAVEGADSWWQFYEYAPAAQMLSQLGGRTLFDPALLYYMDPPLKFQIPENEEGFSGAAADRLFYVLGSERTSGKALLETGTDIIDGQNCYTFALGVDLPERFVTEGHYAVTRDGTVYLFDYLNGDWELFTAE